ncbi:MAG: hypothetical protein DCF16_13030 [Alphaproteobacteria bacterium]|nr:MAG: hypothetical protein DCF16_13030 [Alphaproteobacteria bacterium]
MPDHPSGRDVGPSRRLRNGSGKTTLTRLFDEIAAPSARGVEYSIECSDGQTYSTGDAFPAPLRVFNYDYIQKNVRIMESSANTISILLGEENKALSAQIEEDERALIGIPGDAAHPGKHNELNGYTQKKARKEKENETAFSDIARTVGAAIIGSGAAARNYRNPDAKRDFAALTVPDLLSEEELERQSLIQKQEALSDLPLAQPSLDLDGATVDAIETAMQSVAAATRLCAITVESETLAYLAEHPGIAEWVEHGLRLHESKGDWATCEFCGGLLPQERIALLARHFSEADRKLKVDIDETLTTLRSAYAAIDKMFPPDSARLYKELQSPFSAKLVEVETAKKSMAKQIAVIEKTLQEKKSKTTEAVTLDSQLDAGPLREALANVNAIIEQHNARSRDFHSVQSAAIQALKTHYLSTIFEDVSKRKAEIDELEIDLKRRAAEIEEINQRIASARAQISSAHKACGSINDALRTFLGRGELSFEPEMRLVDHADGEPREQVSGYKIMRGNEPASHLSEGEKTAIAFVYFVVHLGDGQFQKGDGIIVIDDPVSSLDSNSLYQAFSFLKNAVTGSHQVFVLTHNFEFLRLLLNWRSGARRKTTGCYMIRNQMNGHVRCASIEEMDKELKDYESEYHYLFKRLKEMRADQDGTIAQAYPVPNVARKVWETFLMFRVPNGQSPYSKIDQLKKDGFDPQKLDAIYKFTNDQSHITGSGFDPSLVPEAQKILSEIFEMMEKIAPEHFAILDKATSP